jgi:nucleoid-associated protein YgaU
MPEGSVRHTRVKPYGCVTVYKVEPGDTLWDLAQAFAVEGADLTLYEWNHSAVGRDPDLIHPGQLIIVDPTGKVTAPTD